MFVHYTYDGCKLFMPTEQAKADKNDNKLTMEKKALTKKINTLSMFNPCWYNVHVHFIFIKYIEAKQ